MYRQKSGIHIAQETGWNSESSAEATICGVYDPHNVSTTKLFWTPNQDYSSRANIYITTAGYCCDNDYDLNRDLAMARSP